MTQGGSKTRPQRTIGVRIMRDTTEKTGKVWLVGAGPGDRGLMTLKGADVLAKADAVVYDALIGSSILSMMPENAEKIYVGKRAGRHTRSQSEINQILLEKAQQGLNVVRLKGGDPFVFGRGGEELELLAENGIPYEVVPGVTSAFAVPAYAGIPVTHRNYCSGVHVITGHRRKDHTYDIDFVALTEGGGTLVFVMGIASLPVIAGGLLSAGMDPDTPAAIVEKGTTASQRTITSTLAEIQDAAQKAQVSAPAVIIVGDVTALSEQFSWRQSLPLAGVRAVVTRPRELSSELAEMLRERGAETIELPTISIEPVRDNTQLYEAITDLRNDRYEWIVFTSPSGVRVFMDALMKRYDVRTLAYCSVAAIGKGTEKELAKYGVKADMIPSKYDGRTLGSQLASRLRKNDRVLIPRARIGNQELIEELSRVRGVSITDIPTYDTVYSAQEWFNAEEAFHDPHTYALFTSASTVRGFAHAYPDMKFGRVRAVCIGEQTAAEARSYGMKTAVSRNATLESLAGCLEEVVSRTVSRQSANAAESAGNKEG